MEKSVYDRLKEYENSNIVRMHMPGHKGRTKLSGMESGIDITEINGFDNLHSAESILLHSMKTAARVWESKESFYLVNGSTCGILASIRALTKRGDKVLVARNSHKSVYHAIELCGLVPIFIMPPVIKEWGIFGSVTEKSITDALEREKDIKLVIITSPTYEGVVSDIQAISKAVHSYNIPLIVDESHGAHLGFSPFLCGAVKCGADVVIQSLHKTLNCPTQSAIMHVCSNRVSLSEIRHQLSVFETSSPSYVIMSAIDSSVREIDKNKNIFSNWKKALDHFYKETKQLETIQILGNCYGNYNEIYDYDKTKIVIKLKTTDLTPYGLFSELRGAYSIECEMASSAFVLAMTGMGDDIETLGALSDALLDISSKYSYCDIQSDEFIYNAPQLVLLSEEAMKEESELVSTTKAKGRISAEYVWEYPPGVPILIPGERIGDVFSSDKIDYSKLKSTSANLPYTVSVLKNTDV